MFKSDLQGAVLEREARVDIPRSPDLDNAPAQDSSFYVARLIWRNRKFFGRAVAISTLFGILATFLIPVRYESTARLVPPDPESFSALSLIAGMAGGTGGTGGKMSPLGSMAGDLLGVKSSGALFEAILHSRTVQDKLIERFQLRKVYWDKYWEDARKDLANRTDVAEDRKSGVITITFTDHNPQRAQQMTQVAIEELDRLVAQLSTSSAHRERVFIEGRLAQVKGDLGTASTQFSEFASKNGAIDITAQTKAEVEGAAMLEGQLITARSELEGLQQIYTSSNVRVRAAQARIAELEKQLQKVGGTSSDTAFDPARDLYPPLRQLPVLGVRWLQLYRDTKIQETVYELLSQQYEIARIQEAKEIPTVKVLDPPIVPEKKSFPPRMLFMFTGFLLACVGATVCIAWREYWQAMSIEDPRKLFLIELLDAAKSQGARLLRNRLHVSSNRTL